MWTNRVSHFTTVHLFCGSQDNHFNASACSPLGFAPEGQTHGNLSRNGQNSLLLTVPTGTCSQGHAACAASWITLVCARVHRARQVRAPTQACALASQTANQCTASCKSASLLMQQGGRKQHCTVGTRGHDELQDTRSMEEQSESCIGGHSTSSWRQRPRHY